MDKIMRFIQIKNPRSQTWTIIDKKLGKIIKSGKKKMPYKNILMYEGKKDENGNHILKMPK